MTTAAKLQQQNVREFVSPELFPRDFALEHFEEKYGSLFAYGAETIYKFPLRHSHLAFRQAWRLACEELVGRARFAPTLYLGLRCYRWYQGLPLWLDKEPRLNVHPLLPPKEGAGVCIVFRKLGRESSLVERLRSENIAPILKNLALKLRGYHLRSKARDFDGESGVYPYSGVDFLLGRADCPERVRLALAELRRFVLESQMQFEDLIQERREGAVQLVGRLNLGESFLDHGGALHLLEDGEGVLPVGVGDPLSDIAAWKLELVRNGFHLGAQLFEKYSAGNNPSLLRYFEAREALKFAVDRLEHQENFVDAEVDRVLSWALGESLSKAAPSLVVVEENDSRLADELSFFMGATVVRPDVERGGRPLRIDSPELWLGLNRAVAKIERHLEDGSSVVFAVPMIDPDTSRLLEQVASRFHVSLRKVRATFGFEERVVRGITDTVAPLDNMTLLVEPSMSLGENALHVLRSVARR